jgi:sulfatase modifying factor 1
MSWGYCTYGKAALASHPINCLLQSQAAQFCAWAGGRLPTEVEWLNGAGIQQLRRYPWGPEPLSCERAIWGGGRENPDGCGTDSTWPVCSKPKGNSPEGLCDMIGNVKEWTSTRRNEDYYVLLLGGWFTENRNELTLDYSNWYLPTARNFDFGVRCARQ